MGSEVGQSVGRYLKGCYLKGQLLRGSKHLPAAPGALADPACTHSLKLGSAAFPRGDLAQVERSVGRLHTMHARMLMDIEKVQIHFGGSVKASSQMIRELLQAQCLSSPCYKRWGSAPATL